MGLERGIWVVDEGFEFDQQGEWITKLYWHLASSAGICSGEISREFVLGANFSPDIFPS